MSIIPPSVSTYLQDYAPEGWLIAYWLDKNREYNVLVLYQKDGEYRFSIGAFPEVVGHWGHQLTGGDYNIEEIKDLLGHGLWDADEVMKERLRSLTYRIESGWEIDDILSSYRKIEPFKPNLPHRGPHLSNEGQYRTITALVNAISDENMAIASETARKLASMGLTEDDGPLFVRNALLKFRKRKSRDVSKPNGHTAPPPSETKKETIPSRSAPSVTTKRRIESVRQQLARTFPAYALMLTGSPLLILVLGVIYGSSLTSGKEDYLWVLFIACGIWGFFAGVVKLCRFKHPGAVFTFALLTALGVLSWGHYVDYDWQAKEVLYQRVHNDIIPRGRWVPGTKTYRAFQPEEIESYPSEWKKLERNELYVQYLRRTLRDDRADGFLDHLRVRAKEGFVTPPHGKWPASYRGGFWVWWAWGVHAFLFFVAALLSAASSFMESNSNK